MVLLLTELLGQPTCLAACQPYMHQLDAPLAQHSARDTCTAPPVLHLVLLHSCRITSVPCVVQSSCSTQHGPNTILSVMYSMQTPETCVVPYVLSVLLQLSCSTSVNMPGAEQLIYLSWSNHGLLCTV